MLFTSGLPHTDKKHSNCILDAVGVALFVVLIISMVIVVPVEAGYRRPGGGTFFFRTFHTGK